MARLLSSLLSEHLRICVVPNFVTQLGTPISQKGVTKTPKKWLAAGRFTPEKGFLELVYDWPGSRELTLIGDGEQAQEIRKVAQVRGIRVLGPRSREDLRGLMMDAIGLIFPSRWFEVDPQIVAEALSLGVPVIAFGGSASAELIEISGAGSTYSDRESLLEALDYVTRERDQLSKTALDVASKIWTPSVWLDAIEAVYARAQATYTQ
jgi:glycosyltransferase involved in cell wall biosynthesis